jgi:F-type H+-transporting ATPase subunit delta
VNAFVRDRFPTFAVMMESPVRTAADKDRLIAQAFEGRALPTTVNFLRVLNRHGRLGLLGPVLRAARETWERRQNRRPVTVRSAVPLTDGQADALRDRLAKTVGGTPVLRQEVDPGLIGGIVIQVGDDVYDASVRNRLEQLRQRLIEGKTHEIQSRRDQFSDPA